MSNLTQIVDSLEVKFFKIVNKLSKLEEDNAILRSQITDLNSKMLKDMTEIDTLKKEIEYLKMTNALLGSEEFKKETKLKINSLIREIDYCISQLSE